MRQVYKETGVRSCKVTHHRTHAVQHGGANSLAPYQMSTLTKHIVNKYNTAYAPEVDKQACKVMAGYNKDEAYFNACSHVRLDHPVSTYVNWLLPNYRTWVAQQESREGDKSTCVNTFLYEIIPYLVEVVAQCGIFFVKDFPNHEMSEYLRVSGYI